MSENAEIAAIDYTKWAGSAPGTILPPERRLPTVIAAEGFEGMSYLSAEEQQIGKDIFEQTKMMNIEGVKQPPEHEAIQAVNPYMIFQSDPAMFALDLKYGNELSSLIFGMDNEEVMASTDANGLRTDDPDVRLRYRLSMLIVMKVAQEYEDEWMMRLMATTPSWTLSSQQLVLLHDPDAPVWDEDESLILEFTHAMVHCTVNDELFARAEAKWGRKQMLRYGAWVARYISLLVFDRLNVADREKRAR